MRPDEQEAPAHRGFTTRRQAVDVDKQIFDLEKQKRALELALWKDTYRRFGWYSNRMRGEHAKNAAHAAVRACAEPPPVEDGPTPDRRECRRRWAALIKRVYEVDPMVCPACGHSRTVVSFINPSQREVMQKILTHCGLHERSCRAPPPSTSPLHELTYVSDLEFADAPQPGPVWSAQ